MYELLRTKVDKFELKDAISFEELEENKANFEKYLIKAEDIFDNFEKINLSKKKNELFLNGVKLRGYENFKEGAYKIFCENKFIGIRNYSKQSFKTRRNCLLTLVPTSKYFLGVASADAPANFAYARCLAAHSKTLKSLARCII